MPCPVLCRIALAFAMAVLAACTPFDSVSREDGPTARPKSDFEARLDALGVPLDLPAGKAILVNVPAFELIAFENGTAYQSSHQTKYLDLRGRHTLFICSSLVNNDSVSVNNLRGVLAKVAVTEAYGGLINFQHGGNPYDLVSLRDTSVKRIRFWILDAHGQPVDLRGGEWSATLVFCRH